MKIVKAVQLFSLIKWFYLYEALHCFNKVLDSQTMQYVYLSDVFKNGFNSGASRKTVKLESCQEKDEKQQNHAFSHSPLETFD